MGPGNVSFDCGCFYKNYANIHPIYFFRKSRVVNPGKVFLKQEQPDLNP